MKRYRFFRRTWDSRKIRHAAHPEFLGESSSNELGTLASEGWQLNASGFAGAPYPAEGGGEVFTFYALKEKEEEYRESFVA